MWLAQTYFDLIPFANIMKVKGILVFLVKIFWRIQFKTKPNWSKVSHLFCVNSCKKRPLFWQILIQCKEVFYLILKKNYYFFSCYHKILLEKGDVTPRLTQKKSYNKCKLNKNCRLLRAKNCTYVIYTHLHDICMLKLIL